VVHGSGDGAEVLTRIRFGDLIQAAWATSRSKRETPRWKLVSCAVAGFALSKANRESFRGRPTRLLDVVLPASQLSEVQLESQLKVAWGVVCSEAGDRPEVARVDVGSRIPEYRSICQVEGLRPKLEPDLLANRKGFHQR
jgi:hypothetical protein